MPSSQPLSQTAQDAIAQEPERFLKYVLADAKLRRNVLNTATATIALKKAFASDPTLKNLLDNIRGEGWSEIETRFGGLPEVKRLIESNLAERRKVMRGRVKNAGLRGSAAKRETERRLKLSVAASTRQIKGVEPRQIAIDPALTPQRVRGYVRDGVAVSGYRRGVVRPYSKPEMLLLRNNRNLPFEEIYQIYLMSNFGYRSRASVKRALGRVKGE